MGKDLPVAPLTSAFYSEEQKVTQLIKLVHILWKELEKVDRIIQVIPEGLRIKCGQSEVLVLENGGIILNGLRIRLRTPGKEQLLY